MSLLDLPNYLFNSDPDQSQVTKIGRQRRLSGPRIESDG
jgi:hypothetical protein